MAVFLTTMVMAFVPGVAAGSPAPAANPVILVPGWYLGGVLANPHQFDGMKAALEADGHRVYLAKFANDDNVSNAREIARLAGRISVEFPSARIDLVGHSMGGYSARYYLKYLNGAAKGANYVSIGTSQYGTTAGCLLPPSLGSDICPRSGFLATLNTDDDTPGVVSYTTLRGIEDDKGVYSLQRDRRLDGGVCAREGVDGGPHPGEPNSPVFIALVRQALAGKCPGEFVNLPIT